MGNLEALALQAMRELSDDDTFITNATYHLLVLTV
jgi:hypothetical protein